MEMLQTTKGTPMRLRNKTMILGAVSLLALTACTDPSQYPGTEGDRTRQGALAGAALGGLLGATRESGSDRVRNAAVGAAIGAAAGAAIGYSLDQQARELETPGRWARICEVIPPRPRSRMPSRMMYCLSATTPSSSHR